MAYNKKNKLKRIIDIQNITLEHQAKGVTNEFIYNNHIKPIYHISRDCFYEYLRTNAKRELKILEEDDRKQTALKL